MLLAPDQLAQVQFIQGDVCDAEQLTQEIQRHRISHVIHLAGLQVPTCRANPRLGAMVNVVGTINVFEAARRAAGQVRKVVYASSAAVFGAAAEERAMTERDEPQPSTHYGVFKRCNEG